MSHGASAFSLLITTLTAHIHHLQWLVEAPPASTTRWQDSSMFQCPLNGFESTVLHYHGPGMCSRPPALSLTVISTYDFDASDSLICLSLRTTQECLKIVPVGGCMTSMFQVSCLIFLHLSNGCASSNSSLPRHHRCTMISKGHFAGWIGGLGDKVC